MVAVIRSSTPRFRLFNHDDVTAIKVIEDQVYEFPWSAGIFNDCIRVAYECVALELNDELRGYAIMSVAANEGHLLNICIDPACQKQGFGRQLLEHMLSRAKRLNAQTVFLEVRESNKPARALYESLGFNEIGVRRNYYPGKPEREDGVMFALEL